MNSHSLISLISRIALTQISGVGTGQHADGRQAQGVDAGKLADQRGRARIAGHKECVSGLGRELVGEAADELGHLWLLLADIRLDVIQLHFKGRGAFWRVQYNPRLPDLIGLDQ